MVTLHIISKRKIIIMQHKRRKHLGKSILILLAIAIVGGVIVLMKKDIPVQQKPVELALDAKIFLESPPAE